VRFSASSKRGYGMTTNWLACRMAARLRSSGLHDYRLIMWAM
jgi:hypothetical protein